MRTQQDTKVRMMALDNLRAVCVNASGWSRTFTVSKVSRSRVHVEYSNPDEYGNPDPITAVFPCYPSSWGAEDTDNPRVILDPIRVSGGREEIDREIGWQAIDASIVNAPSLWRMGPSEPWQTHKEIVRGQIERGDTSSAPAPGKPCTLCVKCDAEGGL